MIIDEKGKLFGKINLLDLIIILVVVLALLFAWWFFTRGSSSQTGTVKATYTVEVTQKEREYFDHVKVGESVENGQTREDMGKIVDVEVKPSEIVATNVKDGKFQLEKLDGRYDGLVTIEYDAAVKYPDIMAGKESLKIGKKLALRSESAAMQGFVVGLDFDEKEIGGYAQ